MTSLRFLRPARRLPKVLVSDRVQRKEGFTNFYGCFERQVSFLIIYIKLGSHLHVKQIDLY